MEVDGSSDKRVLARFKSETGELCGSLVDIPIGVTVEQLTKICNNLLEKEDPTNFTFFINENEIVKSLEGSVDVHNFSPEDVVEIVYQQQAAFKVKAVTRCTSSMPGHAEAVISVSFSPDGRSLASGSGDTTVRFWDVSTHTPLFTSQGHKNWVLCIAWSPDSNRLVSGCKNGLVCLWEGSSGKQLGKPLSGHKQWITGLSWEPFHLNPECRHFASSSKDGDIRVWDSFSCRCLKILTGHTKSVTAIKWGGQGLLYSASQDRTIKVWRPSDGVMCRTLEGHAHWVNSLALNTDYVIKLGNTLLPGEAAPGKSRNEVIANRYKSLFEHTGEKLVSGSDDFTLFLWNPGTDKRPAGRLTGHQQLVNDVKFSPDGRTIASASFDKSVRLWCGSTGRFLGVLRGHVKAVYMVSWSADSRLLVTSSSDSTLKVWCKTRKKLLFDLPGHSDEVYAVDWSSDGEKVASGGKDKMLRL